MARATLAEGSVAGRVLCIDHRSRGQEQTDHVHRSVVGGSAERGPLRLIRHCVCAEVYEVREA